MKLSVRQSYKYFMVGEYDKMYQEYLACKVAYKLLKPRKTFRELCERSLNTWGVSFERDCEKWLKKCIEIGLTTC